MVSSTLITNIKKLQEKWNENLFLLLPSLNEELLIELQTVARTNPIIAKKELLFHIEILEKEVGDSLTHLDALYSYKSRPTLSQEEKERVEVHFSHLRKLYDILYQAQLDLVQMQDLYFPNPKTIEGKKTQIFLETEEPTTTENSVASMALPVKKRQGQSLTFLELFKPQYKSIEKQEELFKILFKNGYIIEEDKWIGLTKEPNEFAAFYQYLKQTALVSIKDIPTIKTIGERFKLTFGRDKVDLCTFKAITKDPGVTKSRQIFNQIFKDWETIIKDKLPPTSK